MASIFKGLFQSWNHGLWYVKAAPATPVCESQKVVWMFIASITYGAIGTDAGFAHLGQRTFDCGPKHQEFVPKEFLDRRIIKILLHKDSIAHITYAYYNICIQ